MVLPLAIPMLTVPGLYGSEDEHWQSYWEREYPQVTRVAQADWKGEDRQAWLANLEAAVALIEAPLVLVAHSLGCILVAHWAAQSPAISKVKAAFLVAPPDLDADHFPSPATQAAFSPVPQAKLPFPSQVIASSNDPYMAIEKSEALAQVWGAAYVNLGERGHINAASNLENWAEGQYLLAQFLAC